jgi:anti-sigma B factor antagonist
VTDGSAANEWGLVFERSEHDGRPVLVVEGEVDLSVAPRFAQELEGLVEGAARTAVVDLSGVGFIDSSGVRELLKAHRRAQSSGGELVLRAPSTACRRVLQVSGAWVEFTIA